MDGPRLLRGLDAAHIFERVLVMVSWRWARSLERFLGTQRLQPQLLLLVCAALVAALWPAYQRGLGAGSDSSTDIDPAFAAIWVVGIACALGSAYLAKYHRLAAVILAAAAQTRHMHHLRLAVRDRSRPDAACGRDRDDGASPAGLAVAPEAARSNRPCCTRQNDKDHPSPSSSRSHCRRDERLRSFDLGLCHHDIAKAGEHSKFFLERAYTDGGGSNVVNVILVDFRGFDTLGEITVLGVVALTVFALLRRFRPAADSVGIPEQQHPQNALYDDHFEQGAGGGFLPVPAVIVQLLFPFMVIMAVFLFLRGHDLPGGGFIAGITMAIALILQYMAGGIRLVETRLRINPSAGSRLDS